MRRKVFIIGCALFLLLVLVPAGFQAWLHLPHPSDQYLIHNLQRNEAYYYGLVVADPGYVVSRRGDDLERVLIEESDREWGDVGERTFSSKGYAYSTRELHPLVESLDEFEAGENMLAYRKVKGNWYLYYRAFVEKPE